MIEIQKITPESKERVVTALKGRAAGVNAAVEAAARRIMEEVRTGGFEAVRAASLKFDGAEPFEIPRERLAQAAAECPPALRRAMEKSAENIRAYQERLLSKSDEWTVGTGSRLGVRVRGLHRVGIYVPGGRAAYPSSVLMNAIPAKVAGVGEIVMVTPPTEHLNNAVLAAAFIARVDRVIAVGGVQAVAALTYGAGFIPRVDKLVGPGNAYVAAAKRLAFGTVDIDMVAGPSEILVIADETADPRHVAADMLSQAEHDALASSILVTTSIDVAERTAAELSRQLSALSRAETAAASLRDYGAILVCASLDQAAELANLLAPEHLEIITRAPRALLPQIQNAGAVFLGASSPEPLGDYMAGPSHVLPTSGTARFFSPLSVDSFLKKTSIIEYTRRDLEAVKGEIALFAESEGLDAHANAIRIRFETEDGQ